MFRKTNIMSSSFILLLLFITYSNFTSAQWRLLSGGRSDATFNCGLAFTSSTLVVAGEFGRLERSSDGGATWKRIIIDTILSYRGSFRVDSLTGWIVGDSGIVLKTTDAGNTWQRRRIEVFDTQLKIFFTSPSNGWVIGYEKILKTTDSGASWQLTGLPTIGLKYTSIHFTSQLYGTLIRTSLIDTIARPVILITSDGGASWNNIPENTLRPKSTCILSPSTVVTLSADSLVYKSTDGGNNWTLMYNFSANVNEIASFDANFLYASGDNGIIFISTDGGFTWSKKSSGVACRLNSVIFIDHSTGWAIGAESTVLKTTNGGNNWQLQKQVDMKEFTKVRFFNENIGWALCYNGAIYKTADGGANWKMQSVLAPAGKQEITPLSMDSVYCISGGRAYFSTNSGLNWDMVAYFNSSMSISFPSRDIGYMVGFGSIGQIGVFKTTDAGKTWNFNSYNLGTVYFLTPSVGWLHTYQRQMLKTNDGGLNWTPIYTPTGAQSVSLFFANEARGWSINSDLDLLRTDDSSKSWKYLPLPFGTDVKDFKFFNPDTGWVACQNGIYYTTDGGDTWTTQLARADFSLNSICMLNTNTGWAAGTNGTLFKTTNGGLTNLHDRSQAVPDNHLLKQNYPNPFNPETRIAYTILHEDIVSLDIYDVLGRKLAELVNTRQLPGKYNVVFNAADFTSGVYFYRLRIGNYTEIKKMLLLK